MLGNEQIGMGLSRDPLIDTWEQAGNAHDLEAVMTFFTPDAVLKVVPPPPAKTSVYEGKLAIQSWLEQLLAEKPHIETSQHQVQGNQVHCWVKVSGGRLLRQGLDPVEFGLEAVIQLDKITELTVSLTPETAVKLQR
jgi:SnoaL-like domain